LQQKIEYFDIFDNLNYPVIIIDDYLPIWANQTFLTLQGISEKSFEDIEIRQMIQIKLSDAIKNEQYIFVRNFKKLYFQPVLSKIDFEEKEYNLISFFNIAKRKKLQDELLDTQEIFDRLSEYIPEGIVLIKDKIYYSNPAFEKLCGFSGTNLLSKNLYNLIEPTERETYSENMKDLLSIQKTYTEFISKLVPKNGKTKWIRIKCKLLIQGETSIFLNVISDISKEQNELLKLVQLADFDTLTGIYNRRKFNDLISIEYKRAKRYDRNLCILFFDIDHFKNINDTYGHDIGDKVLIQLSNLVQFHIRETDYFARWGGEEFIVLLPETVEKEAKTLSEHIRNIVNAQSFPEIGNVTISIGITMLIGKERMETFIKRADKALYQAKEDGRNRSVLL